MNISFCHVPSGVSSLQYGSFSLHGLLLFSSTHHNFLIQPSTAGVGPPVVLLFMGLQVNYIVGPSLTN
jgi:hypothetical protein